MVRKTNRMGKRYSVILCFLAGLLLSAVPARAQVASLDMTLGSPRYYNTEVLGAASAGYLPDNPAVMSWVSTSLVGGGSISGARESVSHGSSQKYQGGHYGFRWNMGELVLGYEAINFTIGFETAQFSHDKRNLTFSTAPYEWLSVGLSYADTDLVADLDTGKTDYRERSLTYSTSMKFGDSFYLGLGMFDDRFSSYDGTVHQVAERGGSMVGLAYFGGGKPFLLHVEYSAINRGEYVTIDDQLLGGDFSRSMYTLEATYNLFLFGYSGYTLKRPSQDLETRGFTANVGYYQAGGVGVSLQREFNETRVVDLFDKEGITSITLSFQFGGETKLSL
ncbi:MAG: hypothetical protein OEZ59_04590 [Deltaproteobacteria bacterium]|nr:hypothetical protein [Deltaproteobacteria bacterium]